MKLATYRDGTRDGKLVVVSRDLKRAVAVPEIARTMQCALDNWEQLEERLQAVYSALNKGSLEDEFNFDETACASPLPRAYHWADGSAYVNHVELVRKARGAEMPPSFWEDPLMYQGGSDCFIGPREDIPLGSESWGIDFEGEVAVVTGDVPMGTEAANARSYVRLLMLVNDVSLRGLIPNELAKGFGFYNSKPSSVFSPVAVTPDELGSAWQDGKVHLPLRSTYNGELFGFPNAGEDMTFNFDRLIQHAAMTRPLCAGTIIGSGTVSNKQGTDHGSAVSEGGVGYSCIAEVRMIETIRDGQPSTSFMKFGDTIRIEMLDAEGQSIFGAIDQQVVAYKGPQA
ncbi:fumarylacetoacetate hydrolase family protein [Aliidiomarina haloalkalitolerans]|uniref:2-keto-4-pentenoate hydratase n=1 Tax=Aliidiomarina haloalkalitolerans TaxID=859059 RepID=A0A432VY00_9GAMM|nr:fumarylacetoacetate hydrolase family protein [Aliidiomarina haloalkalitolerans]RUO21583.1 2-keto-4-pentenoate hydratase [Aliidiomarina haloalkalitolerans]